MKTNPCSSPGFFWVSCCDKSLRQGRFPKRAGTARHRAGIFNFDTRESAQMSIERKEVGPRMSQIVGHGNTAYLAGVVAQANKGKSVADQTKEIVATIDKYLAQAGTDKTKLLSANIWLADMGTFAEMNAVWDGWVSPGHTPARATVEAKLAAA